MSNNKKFIKFLSWCTGISLILSYVSCVFVFDYTFLNNNFLLTLFGGMFASFCVMLLSEIKKYLDNKKSAEDLLYANFLSLYVEFTNEIGNSSVYLKNKNEIVPSALFDMRAPVISNLNSMIRNVDYEPFNKTALYNNLTLFKQNEATKIDRHIINFNYLHQAINLTQISIMGKGLHAYNPTASDKLVETALTKIKSDAEIQKKSVEGLINAIVSEFPNRFNWKKDKEIIDSLKFDLKEREKQNNAFFES